MILLKVYYFNDKGWFFGGYTANIFRLKFGVSKIIFIFGGLNKEQYNINSISL
jgi:hypothetical protein